MVENTEDFTPRAYQVDLYERAVAENTIIYLPTGSGKTFIAVMLVKKYRSHVELPFSEGGKRIIFIVNTVPLVSQQSEYIARHTGLVCRGYSGDMAVDYWTRDDWLKELEQAQVLVMVGDIFLAILNHGHMGLNGVCLMIFDECHKAVGNHPMRSIMKTFERFPDIEHPRILGLTATLLNANIKVEKVQETVRELEITFHARVATVDNAGTVREYGNLHESMVHYEIPKIYGIENKLNDLVEHMIETLNNVKLKGTFDCDMSSKELSAKPKNVRLKNMIEDSREHIQTMGLYGGSKAVLMHIINLEYMKKSSDDLQTIAILEFLVTQMTKMRKLMDDRMSGLTELDQMYKFSSDQVLKTFEVLKHFDENKMSDQKFCCIVFVRRRTTAHTMYHILKNLCALNPKFKFLLPDYIIGYQNNPYKNPRENLCVAKWNKEALLKFRSGRTNCIVATDVVDEGVDVPCCTLILRYDLPMDFRGYVQSKGRARHKHSRYVILLSRDDASFISKYDAFQRVETHLKRALIGHSDDRQEVSKKELDENLYCHEIQPYIVVNKDGLQSTVTDLSAISLVNRYCSNLMKSKFVNLTPTWILDKISIGNGEMKFKVSLTLPPISPLRDTIESDIMDNIALAKRSAALKTCKRLHQIGELSDSLLPIEASAILENTENLFPHWCEEVDKKTARTVGTTGKKRSHAIVHPKALYGAFPDGNKKLYLHLIVAKPAYPQPFENRQLVFYQLLDDDASFAILTVHPMPEIPGFPIFMNVGELNVNVKANHATFTLSEREIAELLVFHWTIFHNVLAVVKTFMAFDRENLSNSFLIVPTDKTGNIDWTTVKNYKTVEQVPPSEDMNYYDFNVTLVTPNYRSSPNIYIVTQVCEDIMPESAFPNGDFMTYQQYYKEHRSLEIRNLKQPMLEVKAISKKINCTRPRGIKPGASKRKRADELDDFEEHFVGELCNRTIFPAVYWLKATYLPSVLHRICQLLVAEDLRTKIVTETGLGTLRLPRGSSWSPIVIKSNIDEEQPDVQLELSTNEDSFARTSESQLDIPGPEIDTLESKLYPWKKDSEPVNLYKDIEKIQLIDVEYYFQFMSSPMATDGDILKTQRRAHQFETRALMKAPTLYILSKNEPSGPSPALVMQGLTSKSSHDVFDLERLETLGDSLLKFAVSLYLYEAFPKCNEGQLTVLKGRIIGNRNLYYCGEKKQIAGRMKVDDFEPMNNFIAPAFTVVRPLQRLLIVNEISPNVLYELNIPPAEQLIGVLSDQTWTAIEERVINWDENNSQTGMDHFLDVQIVPDKSVSDCIEALVGVYLNSMGVVGAFKILMWFGILPEKLKVNDVLCRPVASPRIGLGNPDDHIPQAAYIERQIGYKFNDRAYLLQAFTHPSYTPNNITPGYERLEFLGDAILDFLITVHIYESCDYLTPGALTDLRSALVNNITFACLAVKYGFHTALMAYAPKLQEIIERFVKFQEDRNHKVDDELLWILLEEEDCKMAEYVDVPKILGDLFESVVGAIYLDTGKDLVKVWEIVYGLMHKEIIAFSKKVPKQPIRVIYETPGANPRFLNPSIVEGTEIVMITLEVQILGQTKMFHGFGANKKQAKCAAAKQALKCIRSNN